MAPKNSADRTWKQAAQDWVFVQGVSTILLGVVVYAVPYLVREIKAERQADRDAHKAEKAEMAAAFNADQARDEEERKELKQMVKDLVLSVGKNLDAAHHPAPGFGRPAASAVAKEGGQ